LINILKLHCALIFRVELGLADTED